MLFVRPQSLLGYATSIFRCGMRGLDKTDCIVLNKIQEMGLCVPRVSKVAKVLGMPVTTVYQRLKKLEKAGAIKGYSAAIDADKVDKPITTYMFAAAKHGVEVDKIGHELCKIPEVQEVHFITGDWDFLLKFKTKSIKTYYDISANCVMSNSNITRSMGVVVPKTFKETARVVV